MRLVTLAASALLLSACAVGTWNSLNPPPGTPRDQVLAQAGPPTRAVPLPGGGQRLVYSMQPMGRETYMVDIDPAGRVAGAYQALTEANFNRIEAGKWTAADIEREFGPPAWVDRVASWQGPVLTYRWRDIGHNPMFYFVYLDAQGVVQRAHPGMEFVNAPNEQRR